jgi:hypothetical protein
MSFIHTFCFNIHACYSPRGPFSFMCSTSRSLVFAPHVTCHVNESQGFVRKSSIVGPCFRYSPTAYYIELHSGRARNKAPSPSLGQSSTIPSRDSRCAFCHPSRKNQTVGFLTWDLCLQLSGSQFRRTSSRFGQTSQGHGARTPIVSRSDHDISRV